MKMCALTSPNFVSSSGQPVIEDENWGCQFSYKGHYHLQKALLTTSVPDETYLERSLLDTSI